MKRTSNYGLPLIKVVTKDTIEEIQNAHRNDILRLRVNLERIRNLSYMIIRREKTKRMWLTTHRSIVEKSLSIASGFDLTSLISSNDKSLKTEEHDRSTPDSLSSSASSRIAYNFPEHQPIVSLDEIFLAQNVMNANIIYNEEKEEDKVRLKRVTRELNRLVKVNHLRRREPNPYEKPYVKPRTPSTSSKASSIAGDSSSVRSPVKLNGPSSPHKNQMHNNHKLSPSKTPVKSDHHSSPNSGIKKLNVNGPSILIKKKDPLTPKKSSSSENLKQLSISPFLLKKKSKVIVSSQLKLRNHKNNQHHPQSLLKNNTKRSTTKNNSVKNSLLKKTTASSRKQPVVPRIVRDRAMNGVVKGHHDLEDDQKQACIVSWPWLSIFSLSHFLMSRQSLVISVTSHACLRSSLRLSGNEDVMFCDMTLVVVTLILLVIFVEEKKSWLESRFFCLLFWSFFATQFLHDVHLHSYPKTWTHWTHIENMFVTDSLLCWACMHDYRHERSGKMSYWLLLYSQSMMNPSPMLTFVSLHACMTTTSWDTSCQ